MLRFCVLRVWRLRTTGSGRTRSSAFRRSERSPRRAWSWSFGRRWSPGTCWRRRRLGAHGAQCGLVARAHAGEGDGAHDWLAFCGGVQWPRVPLTATGKRGEAVAGIRYRARRLSAALHPTIPVHTPLVFDLIDTWTQRSSAAAPTLRGRRMERCIRRVRRMRRRRARAGCNASRFPSRPPSRCRRRRTRRTRSSP